MNENKTIQVEYHAVLREQRGRSSETLKTDSSTPLELYRQLKGQYGFNLSTALLKVAVNDEFSSWDTLLNNNDRVVFIPPVSGG